jgi:hypothetical protein
VASLTAANFHGAYRRDDAVFRNALRLIPLCDDAGEATHFVGLIRDVTHATGVDRLTGLLDRYGLLDRLSAQNAPAETAPLDETGFGRLLNEGLILHEP